MKSNILTIRNFGKCIFFIFNNHCRQAKCSVSLHILYGVVTINLVGAPFVGTDFDFLTYFYITRSKCRNDYFCMLLSERVANNINLIHVIFAIIIIFLP